MIETFTEAEASGAIGRTLLELNNAHAVELSLLEAGRFAGLVAGAFWAGRVGAEAMVIALDQDAAYDSPNFQWFRGRFERFVYVDRVVVSPGLRGRGVARGLYREVIRRALAAGHERVVCEVNVKPANEASMRMHVGMGFCEVGDGAPTVGKRVAYLATAVGPALLKMRCDECREVERVTSKLAKLCEPGCGRQRG